MKKTFGFLLFIAILAGCVSANANKVVYQFEGVSMSPTIKDQQEVVVDKNYYMKKEIKRDDIVLFNLGENQHIKRVVGLPNELIQIIDGTIYINSKPLESEYAFVDVWGDKKHEDGIQLKKDEYFIIGDSLVPLTSMDSRSVGPIAKEDILGKVVEIK
jgi:signal peptidase I